MSDLADELGTALKRLAAALAETEQHALIGGLALAFRGVPRSTRDIDLLLAVPRVSLPPLLERLQAAGFSLDLRRVLTELRDDHLTQVEYGSVRIDLLEAILPAYAEIVASACWETWEGVRLRVASSEGLAFLKLAAFRPQDQADLWGLAAANARTLDMKRIQRWYATVGDAGDARWRQFSALVEEIRGATGDGTAL
jgi:hypothetical protein